MWSMAITPLTRANIIAALWVAGAMAVDLRVIDATRSGDRGAIESA
jgi:hypothetical protein